MFFFKVQQRACLPYALAIRRALLQLGRNCALAVNLFVAGKTKLGLTLRTVMAETD